MYCYLYSDKDFIKCATKKISSNQCKCLIERKASRQMYEVKGNSFFSDQNSDLIVIPGIHIVTNRVNMILPYFLVNLSIQLFLAKMRF